MTSPIQLLRAKKQEITDQYNRALNLKYGSNNPNMLRSKEAFEDSKRDDLRLIKNQLDEYNEAINSLVNIKDLTF
jgi:hypothetical protein